eukprot:1129012-Amphidinium_carterae.2
MYPPPHLKSSTAKQPETRTCGPCFLDTTLILFLLDSNARNGSPYSRKDLPLSFPNYKDLINSMTS